MDCMKLVFKAMRTARLLIAVLSGKHQAKTVNKFRLSIEVNEIEPSQPEISRSLLFS